MHSFSLSLRGCNSTVQPSGVRSCSIGFINVWPSSFYHLWLRKTMSYLLNSYYALSVIFPVDLSQDLVFGWILSALFCIFLHIKEVPNIFNGFLLWMYAWNWFFLLALFTSPGVWALHLWSNGTLCSNFYLLESIWLTHSACSSLSWKFSFIGSAAFLQCSGMMIEICA